MLKHNLYSYRKRHFSFTLKRLEDNQISLDDEILIIPSGINIIEPKQFKGVKIKKVIIPKTIREIDMFAFEDCQKLEEVIFENSTNLIRINTGAFKNCPNLKIIKDCKINKQNTLCVRSICSKAFMNCKSLTTIDINELEWLSYDVFEGCSNLEVYLPKTLKQTFLVDNKESISKMACTFVIDKDNKYLENKLNNHKLKWRYKE